MYDSTRGQPGLVCWFGELLTEKYNPGSDKAVEMSLWGDVYQAALHREWNNTILNLIRKARQQILRQLSGEQIADGMKVTVTAIGWV